MKTKVQSSESLDFVNGTAAVITSGSPVIVGELLGIAETDIAVGVLGALDMKGVHRLPKDAGLALAQGDAVEWDGDSIIAGGSHGHVAYAADAAATTVDVMINV